MTDNAQPTGQIDTETQAAQTPDATQTATPESVTAEAPKAETEAQPTAPENYEFSMPEGVELDQEITADFSQVARDLNLSQESAQKVADVGVKMMQKIAAVQAEAWNQQVEGWKAETLSDPEIGGPRLVENLAIAEKAMNQFAPELYPLLKQSGFANNKEFIRFAYRVGKAVSEDKHETSGNAAPGAGLNPAKVLYPNMN